jgi:cysteine synthase A
MTRLDAVHGLAPETKRAMSAPSLPPLPRHALVSSSVLELVGRTPLLRLSRVGGDASRAVVYAKAEHLNPGGSVKDRIAVAMIEDAEARGLLRPGGVVIEATSGNTGVGLAIVCSAKGYRAIFTMPASMSLERRQLLASFGAEIVLTTPELQMEGAVEKARELARSTAGAFIPGQFDNPANPRVHEKATAVEILEALGAAPDAFVTGIGTGGSATGVGRALRSKGTRIIGVEPDGCATISRGERGPTKIQGLAAGFVPKNYDPGVVDEVRTVTDRRAYDTKVELARKEGLLVGPSSGATVAVALDVARELGEGRTVVTVLADTGERYFSLDAYFAREGDASR